MLSELRHSPARCNISRVVWQTVLIAMGAGAVMIGLGVLVMQWTGRTSRLSTTDTVAFQVHHDLNVAALAVHMGKPWPFVDFASELQRLPVVYAVGELPTFAEPVRSAIAPLTESACTEVERLVLLIARRLLDVARENLSMATWDQRDMLLSIIRRYSASRSVCRIPILYHGTRGIAFSEVWRTGTMLPDPGFAETWFSPVPGSGYGPDFFVLTHLEVADSHVSKTEAWSSRGFVAVDIAVPFSNHSLMAVVSRGAYHTGVRSASFAEAAVEAAIVRIARSRSSDRATALALGLWDVREQYSNCAPRWCLQTALNGVDLVRILGTLRRGDLLVSNQGLTDEWLTRDTKLYLALGENRFRTITGMTANRILGPELEIQGWGNWSWARFESGTADSRNCGSFHHDVASNTNVWTHDPASCMATSYAELHGSFSGDLATLERLDLYQALSNGMFSAPAADANATRAVEWSSTCTSAWKFSRSALGMATPGCACLV